MMLACNIYAQQSTARNIRIDSIKIEKNWITWNRIILRELGFKKGDMVSAGMLDTAERKVWNIGNFATVKFTIDTLPDHRHLLRIRAKDIVNISPIISPHGSWTDYSMDVGLYDGNFLGSNIKFEFRFTFGTHNLNYRLGFTIPRQLLYKNMTLSLFAEKGEAKCYRYINKEKVSGTGYRTESFRVSVGNPNRKDYSYQFTPDFSVGWFAHKTDSALIERGLPTIDYKVNYLNFEVKENMGTIDTRRNQKNGFTASIRAGINLGLDKASKSSGEVQFGFSYAKLFNKYLQLGVDFSSGFSSTDVPSLMYYKGSGDVKGILNGQISGKTFYTGNLALYVTYFSREWLVVEESFYVNVGNGKDTYSDLFITKPAYSVGTGFLIYPPLVTGVVILFYITYSPLSDNWYYIGY